MESLDYLLLMYLAEPPGTDPTTTDDEMMACGTGVVERTAASGQFVAAGVLRPVACATSVRMRSGGRIVTDGPFAETREQLAGYLLIRARDLDEAIAIAAAHPVAQAGTVEIRPVLVFPTPPPPSHEPDRRSRRSRAGTRRDPPDRSVPRPDLRSLDPAGVPGTMVGSRPPLTARIDARTGGAFQTVMRTPEGVDLPTSGIFLEIVADRRIVLTDAFAEE